MNWNCSGVRLAGCATYSCSTGSIMSRSPWKLRLVWMQLLLERTKIDASMGRAAGPEERRDACANSLHRGRGIRKRLRGFLPFSAHARSGGTMRFCLRVC
jgi:hypothetical protein